MASPALLAALSLAAALAAGETTALPVESMALEIRNAQVEDLSGDRLIEVVVRARAQVGEPTWVAYEIPGVARRGSVCCGRGRCCDVEEPQVQTGTHDHPSLGAVAVLVRFASGVAQ